MPQGKNEPNTAAGFLGSIFKYSISTFVNVGILGVSMLLTLLFIPSAIANQINLFNTYTNTIMTIAILGMDQALIRFFHQPPAGLSRGGLFRVCFYLSSGALLVAGTVCSTLLLWPVYSAIGFSAVGGWVVPLLFLNAFFYMIARYFSVLYRMEGNILLYTTESILMQLFYKLFYLLGNFLGFENPVPAMVLCSVLGLGGFALVFSFLRRGTLRLHRAEFNRGAYKTVLPYALAVAPTAVMLTFNAAASNSILTAMLGNGVAGIYGIAYMLSNIVTTIQGGFASFWGPYMFANYQTQQARIKRVHGYLNLAVLAFFAVLVAVEDILFWLFPLYAAVQPIFPLMMLSAVFTILCETTVYGNAIARRPIFDTIGIGLSFGVNIVLLLVLGPRFGLHGAAVAIAAANFTMFAFRTVTGQRLYKSIQNPGKTVLAVALAVALAAMGTVFAANFLPKLLCSLLAMLLYIVMYRQEFVHLLRLGLGMLQRRGL